MYHTLPTTESKLFSSEDVTFSMINHMLVHKIRLDLKELKPNQECSLITVKLNKKATTKGNL